MVCICTGFSGQESLARRWRRSSCVNLTERVKSRFQIFRREWACSAGCSRGQRPGWQPGLGPMEENIFSGNVTALSFHTLCLNYAQPVCLATPSPTTAKVEEKNRGDAESCHRMLRSCRQSYPLHGQLWLLCFYAFCCQASK